MKIVGFVKARGQVGGFDGYGSLWSKDRKRLVMEGAISTIYFSAAHFAIVRGRAVTCLSSSFSQCSQIFCRN